MNCRGLLGRFSFGEDLSVVKSELQVLHIALFLGMLVTSGCGGGKSAQEEMSEAASVKAAAYTISDYAKREGGFSDYLASGVSIPVEDHPKYSEIQFNILEPPVVSGDTAVAKVTFRDPSSGTVLGEREWSFVKEGGSWKLKDIPLP